MSFQHGLKPSDVLKNRELMDIFKIGISGGMRKSTYANALIIISDHTKSIYDDRWVGDVFHYTGMGLEGPQSLDYKQNKTLNNSNREGTTTTLYLFEVFQKGQYIYQGEVYLADEPYTETQPDKNGTPRKVYVFPLKLMDGQEKVLISKNAVESKEQIQEKEAKKLNDDELKKRTSYAPSKPGSRNVTTNGYERNAYVSEYAKRRANGICQLCEEPAPFKTKKGDPYLETHHIVWLANGGEDSIENTVALCANCHRKMHSLNLEQDVQKLKIIAVQD
ncbi:restriction endonuclease [Bacillus sp. SA1-12]|uniref:HNH endonuclease n=1 Tax=Bacillus sp. SA1-12 TaxID=1455638 RepID=UPI00062727B5|nr:HNH endonuclease [Bacillus sp. SA1-12]KKI90673.1 restriction endonuclease [Bacillus sp. SA1-12]